MSDASRPPRRLSFLDRDVTVRIFVAMAPGVFWGRVFARLSPALTAMSVGTTTIPIAMGLPQTAATASGK